MARPRGYGYPLIPDPYPVRTWSVPVGYLPCQTGYLPTLHRVPLRIGPCHASMSGPWHRVPDLAYLPMQQVGRLWIQHLEASHSRRSQPMPASVQNFWTQHFGHSTPPLAAAGAKQRRGASHVIGRGGSWLSFGSEQIITTDSGWGRKPDGAGCVCPPPALRVLPLAVSEEVLKPQLVG